MGGTLAHNKLNVQSEKGTALRAAADGLADTLGGSEVLEMVGAITKDPDILGGEPVFRGTRVPFKILLDYLESGDTLDQFLEQYPSVSRELAVAALRKLGKA